LSGRFAARRLRRHALQLVSALGLAQRGLFIPYRHADTLAAPFGHAPYEAIASLFKSRESAFRAALGLIEGYAPALLALGREPPPAPRFEQDWFPRLDAALAYSLMRKSRPRRIVEVGSGHSTRFLARAVKDEGLAASITAIDPKPRAGLTGLDSVRLIRAPLQQAGLEPFAALEAGDVLFIDSSHVLMPGSDVDILINRVIPALPSGVLVHLHDIFLPDDYPVAWSWRGYNEQLAVAPMLLGGGFELLFASHYAATRMNDALAGTVVARLPMPEGAYESGLWLRRA
jgi:predicted O-methyltransferase YrrM